MLDKNITSYQRLIVSHFGYDDSLEDEFLEKYFTENYFSKSKVKIKNLDVELINDNKELKCICCSNVYEKGLFGKDLLSKNKIFSTNFTETYSLSNPKNKDGIKFICSPCLFALKNYGSSNLKLKLQNIVVFKDRVERISIQSNKDNEMYEYLLGEFKEPFIMLINSRGKVLEYITHLATPTVSDNIKVIVFGTKVMYINKQLLKECLADTVRLINELKISKNLLLNTKADESRFIYFATKKNLAKESFLDEMKNYHSKYDADTRIVAGKLLEKYIKLNKN